MIIELYINNERWHLSVFTFWGGGLFLTIVTIPLVDNIVLCNTLNCTCHVHVVL